MYHGLTEVLNVFEAHLVLYLQSHILEAETIGNGKVGLIVTNTLSFRKTALLRWSAARTSS